MKKLYQMVGIVLVCSSLFVVGNSFAGNVAKTVDIGASGGFQQGPGGLLAGHPILRFLVRVDHVLDHIIMNQLVGQRTGISGFGQQQLSATQVVH